MQINFTINIDGILPQGTGNMSGTIPAVTVCTDTIPAVPTLPPFLLNDDVQVNLTQQAGDSNGLSIITLSPDDIAVYPGLQYKRNGIIDELNAVSDSLKGTSVYDVDQGGILTVWQTVDNQYYAVNGHHRLELAKRAVKFLSINADGSYRESDRLVKASILRELDNWTFSATRAMGCLLNVRDGNGTAIDAIAVLRDLNITPDKFGEYGISITGKLARNMRELLKLSPIHLSRVQSNDVSEDAGAGIASVPGLSQSAITGACDEVARGNIADYQSARRIAELFLAEERAGNLVNMADSSSQSDLFDGMFSAASLAIAEKARIEEYIIKLLTKERSSLLSPIKAELIDGEVINIDGRTQAANELGKSRGELTGKIDLIFRHNAEVKNVLTFLAKEMKSGKITVSSAADSLLPMIRQAQLITGNVVQSSWQEEVKIDTSTPSTASTPSTPSTKSTVSTVTGPNWDNLLDDNTNTPAVNTVHHDGYILVKQQSLTDRSFPDGKMPMTTDTIDQTMNNAMRLSLLGQKPVSFANVNGKFIFVNPGDYLPDDIDLWTITTTGTRDKFDATLHEFKPVRLPNSDGAPVMMAA